MNIVIYTKSGCPNCVTAKRLLDDKGLEYTERDVGIPEWRDSLTRNVPGIRQMPAIFVNNQYVGGLAGLQSALKQVGI